MLRLAKKKNLFLSPLGTWCCLSLSPTNCLAKQTSCEPIRNFHTVKNIVYFWYISKQFKISHLLIEDSSSITKEMKLQRPMGVETMLNQDNRLYKNHLANVVREMLNRIHIYMYYRSDSDNESYTTKLHGNHHYCLLTLLR